MSSNPTDSKLTSFEFSLLCEVYSIYSSRMMGNIFLKSWTCNQLFIKKKSQYIFQDNQTPPSSSLKFVEFETCYIILNQILPSFSANNICNGPATWSILTSHYVLRTRDYIKRLSPWYNLWMRVKGPHHYKVTALGLCVKQWSGRFLGIIGWDPSQWSGRTGS